MEPDLHATSISVVTNRPPTSPSPETPAENQSSIKTTTNEFLASLFDDLKHHRLSLPTLPDVALKAQQTVINTDLTATALAKTVSADAALSSRVVQMANSVLLRGRPPVASVQTMIARMGIDSLRNLTACLAMAQVWRQHASPLIDDQLKSLWTHTTRVAALCAVIAR